jgi:hypothetical protein
MKLHNSLQRELCWPKMNIRSKASVDGCGRSDRVGPEAGSILFLTSVVIRVSSQVAIVSISVIGLSDALWGTMGWGSKTFGLSSSGAR